MSATQTQQVSEKISSLVLSQKKPQQAQWWSETAKEGDVYPYERFMPTFGEPHLTSLRTALMYAVADAHLKFPPLTEFEHTDPGHKAVNDPNPRAFLQNAIVEDLTPGLGTEVSNIQLTALDEHARAQLALYVAQRGVVVSVPNKFLRRVSLTLAIPVTGLQRSRHGRSRARVADQQLG